MPTRRDLSGGQFGLLTVLFEAARPSERPRDRYWTVRCSCGAVFDVSQHRLPVTPSSAARNGAVTACDACRSRPCVICGAPVPPSSTSVTCSSECAAEKKRNYQREYYHTKRASPEAAAARRAGPRFADLPPDDPAREKNRARSRKRRAECREDLNAAARARHAERMATDPEYRARVQALRSAWKAAHPDETRAYARNYRRRIIAREHAVELGTAAEILQGDDSE